MPRTIETIKLRKTTLNLYDGDLDRLSILYPDLDPSVALRRLLHSILEAADRAAQGDRVAVNLKLEI